MTDMRATERLLEVIEEGIVQVANDREILPMKLLDLMGVVNELRRRGDTLVRRDDLRRLIESVNDDPHMLGTGPDEIALMERLENAIGER